MPEEIQLKMLHSVAGLQHAELMRPGYAIEYDVIEPWQLTATMETKIVKNLFTAGQMNGTSGYEEAAGQGIMRALMPPCVPRTSLASRYAAPTPTLG